jgi:fermentation-respiration switch protein FrsA (DUF1100 family)
MLDVETMLLFAQFYLTLIVPQLSHIIRLLACLDIYPNINRICCVRCPVMVIHGKLDEEVGFRHGVDMYEAVPEEYRRDPWWVADRGHNDITEGTGKMAEYIHRLRRFLDSLDE